MSEPKMLKDFLDAQKMLMKPKSSCVPANKMVMRPEEKKREPEPEDEYTMIITKKPAKKKVEKYLQELVDAIMEAQDM